jgi:hypothetical protein
VIITNLTYPNIASASLTLYIIDFVKSCFNNLFYAVWQITESPMFLLYLTRFVMRGRMRHVVPGSVSGSGF